MISSVRDTPWHRVTRQAPCAICGKHDWCTYTEEAACCMRVESRHPARNGGWVHFERLLRPPPPIAPHRPAPTIDPGMLIARWLTQTRPEDIRRLSGLLGVSEDSLRALEACWSIQHCAWAFPMRDGQGNIVGIRLRSEQGKKWAVTGSRQGVFVPAVLPQDVALVCEGPTDTAAAVHLGFFAVGRPSCNTGGREIKTTFMRLGVRRFAMASDNDGPGRQGALRVAAEIGMPHILYCPVCKDLRGSANRPGARAIIEGYINQGIWRR